MLGISLGISVGTGSAVALFGSNTSGDVVQATADAVSAIAFLDDNSTTHVKNTVFQYVYNESLGGRWQHMKRLWIARTNLASAYTCLKTGNAATPSDTFAFTEADGIVIPDNETVDFNYALSGDFTDLDDLCIGTAVSFLSTGGSNTPMALAGVTLPSTTAVSLGYNSTLNYWSGTFNGGATVGTADTRAAGYNTISRLDMNQDTNVPRLRYADESGDAPYIFAFGLPDTLVQNLNAGANTANQTWIMTYAAHSDLDWETFRDNTNEMIAELAILDAPAQAVIDAEDAVARLAGTTTDYVKNIISQYVYNESVGGRWQHMTHLWVARTNLASAYTCLKTGLVATPSDTLTHNPQDGIVIPSGDSVNFNTNMLEIFGVDAYTDFCMGTWVSDFSGSGSTALQLISGETDGGITGMDIHFNSSTLGYYGSLGGGGAAGELGAGELELGFNRLYRVDQGTQTRIRYDTYSGEAGFGPFSGYVPTSLTQNSENNNGSSTAQTWGMTYVASSSLDWETFRDNTTAMMEALALPAEAFSTPITDGDSLEVDSDWYTNPPWSAAPYAAGYRGWISALTEVSIDDMHVNSFPGKSFKQIASASSASDWSLDLAIAANPDADSLIIGAGINDIINAGFVYPAESLATIEGYVDNIFAQFVAADNLKHLLIREVTGIGGSYNAQTDTTTMANRWQPFIDGLNAHIAVKVAATDNAYLVQAYAATESSDLPTYAGYQEGFINNSPDPSTMTGGTTGDGDLTIEGVHWKQSGADIVAALGDIEIASARYYKDPTSSYYDGGRPS